ncbi:hypothetical protein [Bordetella hinzii]|uniref:hypothetical protein n=1 Tax=Bordetella hinzii TaxID=103855 RepID=UPI000764969D|nr:hypothetical protein [Bordetella hinzii]KXA71069.1 hypothetical protein AXA74_20415 [Bordetella hinzii LMG 13501]VEH23178.1 Uncharacterised protein [Bordetella hinzii]
MLKSTQMKIAKILGIFVLAPMVALVLVALFGPEPGPEYPEGATAEQKAQILKLHQVKKLSPSYVAVDEDMGGERLVFKYQPKAVMTESSWVDGFFHAAKRTMQRLDETVPANAYKTLVFDVQMPTVDNMGNSGTARGMLVWFDWGKIKAANWDNMTSYALGDLIQDVGFQRLGKSAAREFCKDGDHARAAGKFCGAAAR